MSDHDPASAVQPPGPTTLSADARYRYARQLRLPGVGIEGQQRLAAASVLVVGAGGLGAPALQYLAGAGVGRVGIVDFDRVQAPDLHRQPLYGETALGRLKVEAAAERLADLNPLVRVEPHATVLSPANALGLVANYDVILDGSDNFATRYLVNDAAVRSGRPVVYGAIHRYEGQYCVFNWNGGPTYRCLCPTPPPDAQAPSCSEAGVLGVVAGLVGVQMAWQALAIILEQTVSASGRLTLFDLASGRTTTIGVQRREEQVARAMKGPLGESEHYAGPLSVCAAPDDLEVGAADVLDGWTPGEGGGTIAVVDVREAGEEVFGVPIEAPRVPASMLPARVDLLPSAPLVVLCCETGGRSLAAAARVRSENGAARVKSLRGGLLALDAERMRRGPGGM